VAKQKPGGQPGQLNDMMRQMQKMQADMAEAQAALADDTVEVSAGGGMVKAVVAGTGELRSVSIASEVVDPDDVEMLEDLVLAVCNEAMRAAQELQSKRMGAVTEGLDLGSLGGLLG
jgi:DNA-binding YbaB/EbfC family protein